MADRIILMDGTEIENATVSPNGQNQIMVFVPGTDLIRYTLMFGDPNKNGEIVAYFGVEKKTYKGFTELYGIDADATTTHVYLRGEATSVNLEYTVPEVYLPKRMRTVTETEGSSDGE